MKNNKNKNMQWKQTYKYNYATYNGELFVRQVSDALKKMAAIYPSSLFQFD